MRKKESRKPVLQQQGLARPVVILIIALVAIAGLSLLLFFSSKQFVGKAISFGELNEKEAGFALTQNTLDEGATVTFPVKVNIGNKKSSVLSFELQYDPMKVDVDCSQIFSSLDSLFTGVDENGQQFNLVLHKESSCSGGNIAFSYAALPSMEDNKFLTLEKTVAEIKVTAKQELGATSLQFTSFDVFDLDTGMLIAGLTPKNADVEIVSAISEEESALPPPPPTPEEEIPSEEMPTEEVTPVPEEEQVTQVCMPNQYVCQGTTAYKQCKADGSGYNEPVACAENQVCDAGSCAVPPVSVQGTKITLTDVAPANNVFATKITATEAFATEVTIYTILYDQDGKVLALKSEKLAGLAQGQTYTAAVNYPEANIKRKSVIVYDVKPGVEVSGSLEVEMS